MLSLLVINQSRYIVMLSIPHVCLTTKIVTNEYLHGLSLKVKHNTYSSITRSWDVCMILCSGPKPTFYSRRRDGIFYNASPDLPRWSVATIGEPRMNMCMEEWQGIGALNEHVINNKCSDAHWFKVFVFGIVICRYGDAIVRAVYFLCPVSFGFFLNG